ncbi:MFS transporter [Breznakiellaceae bacterium SP9]
MVSMLSPYRLVKARELYNRFNVFNSLSWQFLIGNIIVIFALRLNASSTYIGIINALLYVAYFFLPVGKVLARRFPIVKVYSIAWIVRSLCMTGVFLAPFAFSSGLRDNALTLTLLGVSLYHTFRGIGMIGNNPVLNLMASGPDRGAYMTQTQIINSAVGMFASFTIAMLLGSNPPLFLYSVICALGIGCGITSGVLIGKIPEPVKKAEDTQIGFRDLIKTVVSQDSLKHFLLILFIVALVSAVSRAFIVVYAREIFAQSDGMVSLYTVFGGLGNLMIGIFIKFLVDRTGSKPLFIICVAVGLLAMVPILFFSQSMGDTLITVILFLSLLFFLMNFGWLGAENISQTYFLTLVPQELMLDMGIVYFFVFGLGGMLGSLLSGVFLDLMTGLGFEHFTGFQVLFCGLIALSALAILLQRKLTPMGALPFRHAIEVMFSFRDLRAISLLDKLNKTSDGHKEEELLGALHDTPSVLSTKGLLERADSPRLATRLESLRAMETLDLLSPDAEKALINDMINHPFTTAYISARILGNHKALSALPILRELSASTDYMLAGEAMVALAKLGDAAFRPEMERIVLETSNPRLKIMGVEAFGIYGSPNSIPVLLDLLRSTNPPPYLRDEVCLALATLLGTQNQFYKLLVAYLASSGMVQPLAMDEAESAVEFFNAHFHGAKIKTPELELAKEQARALPEAVNSYINKNNGAPLSRWILEIPDWLCDTATQVIFSEAVLDDELSEHNRLKLFICHWAASMLRKWVHTIKSKGMKQ